MKRLFGGVVAAFVVATLLVSGTALAQDKDAPNIKIRFLLQSQVQTTENGNPDGDGFGNEFFLRRARIIMAGNISKLIHFFMETDNPNMGKNGDWGKAFFIQDAFVDFRFMPEFNLAAGMILLPFTHHNRQSAASLNSVDYHNLFSGRFIKDFVWRDAGIEARGIVANTLDYHIGIFNGLRTAKDKDGNALYNTDDTPRIAGRLALNIFEPETAFFYGGTYLGKKKVLQFGAGFDLQPGAVLDDSGNRAMYAAVSGDAFWDIPLNDKMEVTGQVAFVWYNLGNTRTFIDGVDELPLATHAGSGMGVYGDLGFRYDAYQTTIGGEWFNSDKEGADLANVRADFLWWFKGHSSNLKLEYAYLISGEGINFGDGASQVTLQSQFLF
jgi:hypothetical protein